MWRKRGNVIPEDERVVRDPARARDRTMNRAVKLLAAKPRSIGELRERLLEKKWTNDEIVTAVIEKLSEYGYLDDSRYAADLAVSRLRQKPQGRYRLQHALSQKKIDRETVDAAIDSAFEKLPESELIDAAIEKRVRLKGRPATRDETKKLFDHLLRRGFAVDLIREKIAGLARLESED